MQNIALIVAMKREIPDIFKDTSRIHRMGNNKIRVVVSGIGQKRARKTVVKICEESPDYLTVLGFCGGTGDECKIGNLIIADRVAYNDQEVRIENGYIDKVKNVLQGTKYHVGKFQTFDSPVFSRKRVTEDTLAVDMESFAIAETARNYHIPILIIKAVSDIVQKSFRINNVFKFLKSFKFTIREAKNNLNCFAEQYFYNAK